jgi:hypothetical protein
MIFFDRGTQRLRYTMRPGTSGWVIYEGERAIAYTDSAVYAKAIAQALNLVQLLTAMGHRQLVAVPGPRGKPELN